MQCLLSVPLQPVSVISDRDGKLKSLRHDKKLIFLRRLTHKRRSRGTHSRCEKQHSVNSVYEDMQSCSKHVPGPVCVSDGFGRTQTSKRCVQDRGGAGRTHLFMEFCLFILLMAWGGGTPIYKEK